ncbi:hypothetical protein CSKR_200525, partial [Clonorchis sinensis]
SVAFLSEEPNSFYCTDDSPIVTDLFGESVDERVIDESDSVCAGYRRVCLACIRKAEQATTRSKLGAPCSFTSRDYEEAG